MFSRRRRTPAAATVAPSSPTNKCSAPAETGTSKRLAVVDLVDDAPAVLPPVPASSSSSSSSAPPVPALSSSSSSSAPPPLKYAGKFIFVHQACRSFTYDELWALDATTRATLGAFDTEDTRARVDVILAPGVKFNTHACYFRPSSAAYRLSGYLPAWVVDDLIDWARTSGQTDCPLTAEAFNKPHVLSCNGRSYSLDAFNEAVKRTLLQGEPLRLEDTTLTALDLGNMKLYPNYSLPGWELLRVAIEFSEALVDTKKLWFSMDRVRARHNPAIAALFDRPDIEKGDLALVSGMHIIKAYQTQHNTFGSTVANLSVDRAVFPRAHIKVGPHLQNVLFRDCVMKLDCWCGMRAVGCRFENCTFIVNGAEVSHANLLCEFDSCTFVYQASERFIPIDEFGKTQKVVKLIDEFKPRVVRECMFFYTNPNTFSDKYVLETPYATIAAKLREVLAPKTPRVVPDR